MLCLIGVVNNRRCSRFRNGSFKRNMGVATHRLGVRRKALWHDMMQWEGARVHGLSLYCLLKLRACFEQAVFAVNLIFSYLAGSYDEYYDCEPIYESMPQGKRKSRITNKNKKGKRGATNGSSSLRMFTPE